MCYLLSCFFFSFEVFWISDLLCSAAARADTSVVYAPSLGKFFFFGGARGNTIYNDVWSLTTAPCVPTPPPTTPEATTPEPTTPEPTTPEPTTAEPTTPPPTSYDVCSISPSPSCATCTPASCDLSGGEIVLIGNFTTLPTAVIDIVVSGGVSTGVLRANESCITLQGELRVAINESASDVRVLVAESPCINSTGLSVVVTQPETTKECKRVTGALSSEANGLFVELSRTGKCGKKAKMAIILGAALGGFALLLVIIAAVLIIFFPKVLPDCFFRKQRRPRMRTRTEVYTSTY